MATQHTNQDELAKAIAEHLAVELRKSYHEDCPLRKHLTEVEIAGLKEFVSMINKAKAMALALFLTAIISGAIAMLWHGFKASILAGKP